jgi:hypothetical protein
VATVRIRTSCPPRTAAGSAIQGSCSRPANLMLCE